MKKIFMLSLTIFSICILTILFKYNVYALNKPQTYTVTFLYGPKNSTQIVNEGENAVIPTDTTVLGYTFIGWTDSAFDIHSDIIILGMYTCNTPFAQALNASTTVKKVNDNISAPFLPWWTDEKGVPGKTCVVRWYSNIDNKIFRTDVVGYGDSLNNPIDPFENGYIFAGWEGSWKNVTEDRAIKAYFVKAIDFTLSENSIDSYE